MAQHEHFLFEKLNTYFIFFTFHFENFTFQNYFCLISFAILLLQSLEEKKRKMHFFLVLSLFLLAKPSKPQFMNMSTSPTFSFTNEKPIVDPFQLMQLQVQAKRGKHMINWSLDASVVLSGVRRKTRDRKSMNAYVCLSLKFYCLV